MERSYHIITIGCQMNVSDSSRLSSFLEKNKYRKEDDVLRAGLIIINTCGIRQSAEDRAYGLVNTIRKKNKTAKIVITGCLSHRLDVQKRLNKMVDLFMPISAMTDILKLLSGRVLKSKLSLDEVRKLQGEKYLTIIPNYPNKFSAFVPIGNGCNNFCSYCVVPYARGREIYRPAKDVVLEVKRLVKSGYKEVTLIAQNVNSYKSGSYDFAKLLEEVANIKGDFWLRFSSSHPKDVSDRLIKVISKYDKICSHFHLAIQSGDDNILKAMNRKYTANHFLKIVEKLRKARPGISITTDVIVGFPGEKKKNFNNTVKLFKIAKFDLAYVSRYSPRPQTAAYFLKDDVSLADKKIREKELESILLTSALENNRVYQGMTVRVLIEGINKKGDYIGRTSSYKSVVILSKDKATKNLIGSFVAVKVSRVRKFGLEGVLL